MLPGEDFPTTVSNPGTVITVSSPPPTLVTAVAAIPGFSGDSGTALQGGSGYSVQFPNSDGTYVSTRGGHRAVILNGKLNVDGQSKDYNPGKMITVARWSPDGNWLAYIVETPGAEAQGLNYMTAARDDGVWIVQVQPPNGTPHQVFRNYYGYGGPNQQNFRVSYDLDWAPDNFALVASARIYTGETKSFIIGRNTSPDATIREFADGGATWIDYQRLVAVQSIGYPTVTLGILTRDDITISQPLVDGTNHFWMQNPVRLGDGRIAFLGKPNSSGRAEGAAGLQLYILGSDGLPTPRGSIVPGRVLSASWSPDRQALLIISRLDDGTIKTLILAQDGTLIDRSTDAHNQIGAHWDG